MDNNIAAILNSPTAKKYIGMMLLGYGTDMKYVEAKTDQFHSDIHHLIKKLKPSSVLS